MDKPLLAVGFTPAIQRTLLIGNFRTGQVNRASSVSLSASGKAVNLALAYARAGGKVVLSGFCPCNGVILPYLRESGIDVRFTEIDKPLRTCTTIVDLTGASVTELVEEAPSVTEEDFKRLVSDVGDLLPRCPMMTLSGTVPRHFPVDSYSRLANEARRHGVPFLVDTAKEPLLAVLGFEPLLVKINREELEKTFGLSSGADRTDLLKACGEVVRSGAKNVMVTDGANASILLCGDGLPVELMPPRIEKAVNPIGSGDATLAGIAYGLVRGMDMEKACRLGLGFGSANAATLLPGDIGSFRPEADLG